MHPARVRSVEIPILNYAPRTARRVSVAARVAALVVLALGAIVIGLGISSGHSRTDCGPRGKVRAVIGPNGTLSQAIEGFRFDTGQWPEELKDLVEMPGDSYIADKWTTPYLKHASGIADPWGNAYAYACPGHQNPEAYDLWSLGEDGISGTADDITNW